MWTIANHVSGLGSGELCVGQDRGEFLHSRARPNGGTCLAKGLLRQVGNASQLSRRQPSISEAKPGQSLDQKHFEVMHNLL